MNKAMLENLKKRSLSTVALFMGLFLTLWAGDLAVKAVCYALVAGLVYEWLALCKIQRKKIFWILTPTLFAAMHFSYSGRLFLSFGMLFSMASLGVFLSWFAWHRRFLWGSLALVYFGFPFTCVFWMMHIHPSGLSIFLWMILIVSGNDIGAYLFGSWLKGPKLIPEISPNKTWSGFVGGLIVAMVMGTLGYRLFAGAFPPLYVTVACLVIGLVATLGDLIESLIKRYHRVKDSGNFIPGHGGFLDRLDGILFAIPVTAWMVSMAPTMFGTFARSLQEWGAR